MRFWLLRFVARCCGLGFSVESNATANLVGKRVIAYTFARNAECYRSAIEKCADVLSEESQS